MNCKKYATYRMGDEKQLFNPEVEKVVEMGLERLRPFENHPFKVKDDEAMEYTQSSPSLSQSQRIRALSTEKTLSYQKLVEILDEIKKSDMSRVIFKNSQMHKYFPRHYSTDQIKEEIIELLEKEYKRKERQKKREEQKNV